MSKKITIKLSPTSVITFNMPTYFLEYSKIELAKKLLFYSSNIILLLFAATLFIPDLFDNLVLIAWLYLAIVLLVVFQFIKKIWFKGDFFAPVSYDVLFLLFTTIIAFSLFNSSLNVDNKFNVWGGQAARMMSGISMVSYWFLYYFFLHNHNTQKHLNRFIKIFAYSFVIGFIISLFVVPNYFDVFNQVLILTLPLWIFMSLVAFRQSKIYIVNLILSLIAMLIVQDPIMITSMIVGLMTGIVLLIVKYKLKLKEMFIKFDSDIDKFSEKKLNLIEILEKNTAVIFITTSVPIILILFFWIISENTNLISETMSSYIFQENITSLLFGSGLTVTSATFLNNMIDVFGIIGVLFFFVLVLVILSKTIKSFVIESTKDSHEYVLLGFGISLIAILTAIFLANITDITFIVFWLLIAIVVQYKNLFIDKAKKSHSISQEYNLEFPFKQEHKYFKYNIYAKAGFTSLAILFGIYLILIINTIVIYLN
jgi:hypothetical protein